MATGRTNRRIKKRTTRRRKVEMKYVVRRGVALVVLIGILAAVIWGISAFVSHHQSSTAATSSSSSTTSSTTSKKSTSSSQGTTGTYRSQKAKDSGISDCTANDITVGLSADQATIDTNGTINFTKDFTHKSTTDCLIDTSDDSMVLVVSNSDGVQVWRSDACQVDSAEILLSQSDTYQKATSWNAVISNTAVDSSISSRATVGSNGHGCMNQGESAPHVSAGNYTAELIDSSDESIKSDGVKFTVTQPAS